MADAINPGSAILENIGVSSSWIMVEYRTFPVCKQTFTVNSFDIACILSWNYNSINLPGLFIAGAGFSVVTSTAGSGIMLIQSSTSTSITMNASLSPGYTVSIIFYKFPSE